MYATHRLYSTAFKFEKCGIRVGDRVLVGGLYSGSVKYIGNLDIPHPDAELYVGARLDDPVGDSDGIWYGKRFFHCAQGHAIFVPIHKVHLLVSRQINLKSNPKSQAQASRIQSGSSISKQSKGLTPNKSPQNGVSIQNTGLELADDEQSHAEILDSEAIDNYEQSYRKFRRPTTSKQRKKKTITEEKPKTSDTVFDEVDNKIVAGLPAVVRQQNLSAHSSETKLHCLDTVTPALSLPKLKASEKTVQRGAEEARINQCRNKLEKGSENVPENTYRGDISFTLLPQRSSMKIGSGDVSEDRENSTQCCAPQLKVITQVGSHCRSTCCSTTAEQAIAQMLKEEIHSTYKDAAGSDVLEMACVSDDYLTAKLRTLLRKLYSKPSAIQQSEQSTALNSSMQWRFSHYEEAPKSANEKFRYRCKTAPIQLVAKSKRIHGRVLSSCHIGNAPLISREGSRLTGVPCNSGMEGNKISSADLSKFRLIDREDRDSEIALRKRSLQTLKEEILQLNRLTTCAEEELQQNLANVDSLTSISIEQLRGKVMDLKRKASATFEKKS